jgi:hypothetical protein
MTGPSTTKEQRDRFLELMRDIAVAKERANLTTLSQFAESEANAEGGRHSRLSQIVGTRVAAEYPSQPQSSFSNQLAMVPQEPPLNQDVNALEPVGTHAELLRSLSDLGSAGGGDDQSGTPRSAAFALVRPSAVLDRIKWRSNSARPPSTVSINRP